jgi:hypothetical protein
MNTHREVTQDQKDGGIRKVGGEMPHRNGGGDSARDSEDQLNKLEKENQWSTLFKVELNQEELSTQLNLLGFVQPQDALNTLCSASNFSEVKPLEELVDNSIGANASNIIVTLTKRITCVKDNGISFIPDDLDEYPVSEVQKQKLIDHLKIQFQILRGKERTAPNSTGKYNFGLKGSILKKEGTATILTKGKNIIVKIIFDANLMLANRSWESGFEIYIKHNDTNDEKGTTISIVHRELDGTLEDFKKKVEESFRKRYGVKSGNNFKIIVNDKKISKVDISTDDWIKHTIDCVLLNDDEFYIILNPNNEILNIFKKKKDNTFHPCQERTHQSSNWSKVKQHWEKKTNITKNIITSSIRMNKDLSAIYGTDVNYCLNGICVIKEDAYKSRDQHYTNICHFVEFHRQIDKDLILNYTTITKDKGSNATPFRVLIGSSHGSDKKKSIRKDTLSNTNSYDGNIPIGLQNTYIDMQGLKWDENLWKKIIKSLGSSCKQAAIKYKEELQQQLVVDIKNDEQNTIIGASISESQSDTIPRPNIEPKFEPIADPNTKHKVKELDTEEKEDEKEKEREQELDSSSKVPSTMNKNKNMQ